MPELPVLDYKDLLDRIGGEDDFARELLSEFVGNLSVEVEELKAVLESGTLEDIVHKAHTLKGTAANLSAKALSEAAKAIKEAGRNSDLETARGGISRLEVEAEKLKETFASMDPA